MKTRPTESIDTVVVHRIEVSQEDPSYSDSPRDVARFFLEHPVGKSATGGEMPYPVLIDSSGTITQTVPFNRITPHAKIANATGIGVGCLGDFRERAPAPAQYEALVHVCAALVSALGCGAASVVGHDELTGASSHPDKECPGRSLAMDALRSAVTERLERSDASFDFRWTDQDVERLAKTR
ncbi:MAG: peptidoglycan recognition family protein [Myxococcota bacterium]